MQLAADNNMQIVQPTSASQIFHVLRRQMVRQFRKPLVIMTPKSLLRNKDATSPLADFTKGEFKTVIPEQSADIVNYAVGRGTLKDAPGVNHAASPINVNTGSSIR